MRGWNEIALARSDEQYPNDSIMLDDDGEALIASGASQDAVMPWSSGFFDTELGVSLPIDGYRQSGWLAFA